MSRELKNDFDRLIQFISEYSLTEMPDDKDFIGILTEMHKKYFSILTFFYELRHQGYQPSIVCNQDQLAYRQEVFQDFLSESVSELGSSFFILLHGCYKSSEQVLRSAIENFLKSVGSTEHIDIITNKNMYEVIDLSKEIAFFQDSEYSKLHDKLKELYANMCATVHTATKNNMQYISAIGYFPHFEITKAMEIKKKYVDKEICRYSIYNAYYSLPDV